MELLPKRRNVLVTGASAGIGKSIAEELVKEGHDVFICARQKSVLESVKKDISAKDYFLCDLINPDDRRNLVNSIKAKYGTIDIFVHNTGGPKKAPFMELTLDDWRGAFENLWTSFIDLSQQIIPSMKEKNFGKILVVSSVSAYSPLKDLTISNGLRSGLVGLIKTMALELAPYNIQCNSLCPGFTETERLAELGVDFDLIAKTIPMKRIATPWEQAQLAVYLTSTKSSYITGQSIVCDGGYSLAH